MKFSLIFYLVNITRFPLSLISFSPPLPPQESDILAVVVFSGHPCKFHLLPAGGECDLQVCEEASSSLPSRALKVVSLSHLTPRLRFARTATLTTLGLSSSFVADMLPTLL